MKLGAAMAAFGVLALLYVLFAASSKPVAEGGAAFAKGEMEKLVVLAEPPPQPTAPLMDAGGAQTTLAAWRGKVVLVNLWATWCAPCVEEMPTLAALETRFAGRDFAVVPVSIDETAKADEAAATLARLGEGALPFLIDPSRAIAFSVQAPGLPTSILYDRRGQEIARLAGSADWSGADAAVLIEAALAEEF